MVNMGDLDCDLFFDCTAIVCMEISARLPPCERKLRIENRRLKGRRPEQWLNRWSRSRGDRDMIKVWCC